MSKNDDVLICDTFVKDLYKQLNRNPEQSADDAIELFRGIFKQIDKIGPINKKLTEDEILKLFSNDKVINDSLVTDYFATIYKHEIPEGLLHSIMKNHLFDTSFLARHDLTVEHIKKLIEYTDTTILANEFHKQNPLLFSQESFALFMDQIPVDVLKDAFDYDLFKFYDFDKLSEERKQEDIKKLNEFIDKPYFDDEILLSKLLNIPSLPDEIRDKIFEKGYDPDTLIDGTKNMCKAIYDSNVDVSFLEKFERHHKPYIFNTFFPANIENMPESCLNDFVERCIASPNKFFEFQCILIKILQLTKNDDLVAKIYKNIDELKTKASSLAQLPVGPKTYDVLFKEKLEPSVVYKIEKFFDMIHAFTVSDLEILKDIIPDVNPDKIETRELMIERCKSVISSPYISDEYKNYIRSLNVPILNNLLDFKEDFMKEVYNEEEYNYPMFVTVVAKTVSNPTIRTELLERYPTLKISNLLLPETANKFSDLLEKYYEMENLNSCFKSAIKNLLFNFDTMKKFMIEFYKTKPDCFVYEHVDTTRNNFHRSIYPREEMLLTFDPFKAIYITDKEMENFKEFSKVLNQTCIKFLKETIMKSFDDDWFKKNHPQTMFIFYKTSQVYGILDERMKELEKEFDDHSIHTEAIR